MTNPEFDDIYCSIQDSQTQYESVKRKIKISKKIKNLTILVSILIIISLIIGIYTMYLDLYSGSSIEKLATSLDLIIKFLNGFIAIYIWTRINKRISTVAIEQ